ncbi:hypothetical protein BV25DRAFT_1790974, partial [Artomyces pyxidatus]
MKARDYCCCAIPVVNAGILATLTEQFALGIIAGTLAIATTPIVGAATPSFASWVFAIICYVGAAIQSLGFFGEKPTTFRRYTTLHILITVAAFSVAAVWIALSATRHSTAKTNCEKKFFSTNGSTIDLSSEGETMCEIFPWVDVGIMGGLWVLLAITQTYLFTVVSGYGTGQRADHSKYDSVYSVTNLNSDIPMTNRADAWDARPSTDTLPGNDRFGHNRGESTSSDMAMLTEPYEQPYGTSPPQPAVNQSSLARHDSEASRYSDPYY